MIPVDYTALTSTRTLVMMPGTSRPSPKGADEEKEIDTSCPHCTKQIPRKRWMNTGSKLMWNRRKTPAGRDPLLRPCPHCREELGTVAMREHIPECTKRPATLTPELRRLEKEARSQ